MRTNMVQRPNLYIEKIVFSNGDALSVEKGDIVIFVGPNNVGKSQALKDIYDLTGGIGVSKVVKDILCSESPEEDIKLWFDQYLDYYHRC